MIEVIDFPKHWAVRPAWSLFRRSKSTGFPDMELLSVYRDHGVVPKSSRDDNHNVASEDLNSYQLVQRGDLVVNKMKAWQGSFAISDFQGVVSPAYFVYKATHKENSKFLHYLLRSSAYLAHYNRISSGVRIGQWDLDPAKFNVTGIGIPPRSEQDAIVEFLDRELLEIDTLLGKFQSLQNLATERLQASFSHLTVEPETSSEWTVRKIGHLFRVIGSGTTPTAGDDSNFVGQTPWVTTGELRENTIYETEKYVSAKALRDFSALRIFPKGSMVMALYGATIGRIAFLGVDATVNQACCVMAEPIEVEPRFVYYALQGSKSRLLAAAVGGGQPNISQEIVRQFRIALPPLSEQRRIAEELDKRVRLSNQLNHTLNATIAGLVQRRHSLISSAVTGKIDLRGDF